MSRVVRSWLALLLLLALSPRAALAQDDGLGAEDEGGDDGATESSSTRYRAPADDARTHESAEEPAQVEPEERPESSAAPAVSAVEPGAATTRAITLQAAVGLGMGTLSFVQPTAAGTRKLPSSPFAATEIVLRTRIRPEAAFSLDVLLAYQTSVGFRLQLDPLFGLPEQIDVRAQRFEASVAPVIRLGSAPRDPALAFPLGFAFRSFAPDVHEFPLQSYKLGGPLARAELLLPLGEWVELRAGPEVQWLLLIDSNLRDAGACCQGIAIGGQGSIQANVGSAVRVALAYRQSHTFVPIGAWQFKDVERFLTLRIAGEL
jgi:hypothetical protein